MQDGRNGKLEDVENIVAQAMGLLSARGARSDSGWQTSDARTPRRATAISDEDSDLCGERILITVGGTREAIDPVRFISNHSSGKMGFAVAEAAAGRGAEVTVVAGMTSVEPPADVKLFERCRPRKCTQR